jgi:hypothetical protein
MSQRAEQGFVQQFVAQPAVKAFNKSVLLWLPGCDVVPFDAGLLRPAQDRHAGQLAPIVGETAGGLAASGNNGIEFAPHPLARQRRVGDQRQALTGKIIDHGQDAEAAAVAELVMQEIERPALVRSLRQ